MITTGGGVMMITTGGGVIVGVCGGVGVIVDMFVGRGVRVITGVRVVTGVRVDEGVAVLVAVGGTSVAVGVGTTLPNAPSPNVYR